MGGFNEPSKTLYISIIQLRCEHTIKVSLKKEEQQPHFSTQQSAREENIIWLVVLGITALFQEA